MLSEINKFKILDSNLDSKRNLIYYQNMKKNCFFLKGIKKSIREDLYKSLYPQGSQSGIMYGPSKIHKPLVHGFPKLRPILSALNTRTYKHTYL